MIGYAKQILSIESAMGENIFTKQSELRIELSSVLDRLERASLKSEFDFIITHCEINDLHGVGVLLKRIFPDSKNILTIRSTNLYGGKQNFGSEDLCLSNKDLRGMAVMANAMQALGNRVPRRIISVPYYLDDVLTSVAVKRIFKVPLCTYLMDDQNIYQNNILDWCMRELLQESDLCLGISRELCETYQKKYGVKFWYLPPTVPSKLLQKKVTIAKEYSEKGVLLGNIWSQQWLEELRNIVKNAGIKIDWYGSERQNWLSFDRADLERDGIIFHGYCPESELIERLRNAKYAIVPTGDSEKVSDRPELAKLSLPSRIPYIAAVSNTPIIVIGGKNSAAAKFVSEHKIGLVCDYDANSLARSIDRVSSQAEQEKMRHYGVRLARLLASEPVKDWIWQSLEKKEALDFRYENLNRAVADADAVITPNEITQKHGTGALVKRIFVNNNNIISIRSYDHYQRDHEFGNLSICIYHQGKPRHEIYQNILRELNGSTIKRIFCVPYFVDDILSAIAIKDLFNVPLVTYIMDDQNYYINKIPDDLMREFLSKCSLRLATHPELRDAYEGKYGKKFWLLPAIVPDRLINSDPIGANPELLKSKTGALVGSLWSEEWFEMVKDAILATGVKLDWYGNNEYFWLKETPEELEKQGIKSCGLVGETELAEKLKQYPFVVIPVGTLDEKDDRQELRLSMPGRIIFILATANVPVIIMGSKDTSAARFVKRFKIGVSCDYTKESFARAVEYITNNNIQEKMRYQAATIAKEFSDKGIEEWLWRSLEIEQPIDLKFEKLMPRDEGDIVVFVEPATPKNIYKDFIRLYQVMRRLKNRGLKPDFVIDVGASFGIWSFTVSKLFDNARYILIDPLTFKYEYENRKHHLNLIPNLEILDIAVSNEEGKAKFQVSPDLYGSSLLNPADFRSYETIEVEVKTLDNVAKEKNLSGRGILKLDVQCAEHIVLEGAKKLLEQIDIIVVELSLVRYDPQALIWMEMLELIQGLGFRYYDEIGGWRSPVDGTLLQQEAVFIRKDLFVPKIGQEIETKNDLPFSL